MVTKMPANSTATSIAGPQVNRFAARTPRGVPHRLTSVSAAMTSSAACAGNSFWNATASTTPASSGPLSVSPVTRTGSAAAGSGGRGSRRNAHASTTANSISNTAFTASHCGHSRSVQVNGTPFR